jgi:hypothetical protein
MGAPPGVRGIPLLAKNERDVGHPALVRTIVKAIVGFANRFRPTYPDFLHGASPTPACAAFIKESRMRCANASKPNRKSGVRWGERGAPVLFLWRGWDPGDSPVDYFTDSLHPLPPGVVSRTLANYLESAHMADVIRSVDLDLKSVWIKELERFLRLGVRELEVHFR